VEFCSVTNLISGVSLQVSGDQIGSFTVNQQTIKLIDYNQVTQKLAEEPDT
jgi:hypothetical protein